ncbi:MULTISPECIES: DUF6118 family protein [Rhizobiaceae]|jgi:hypothetical protein|uniref:DUF6118 family protein n=1 Tax=Rhizobium sp. X9 TaxID=2815360 RepID=UPI001C0B4E0A|nr:DUF6118 family protein [Rhizobium sp. X9]
MTELDDDRQAHEPMQDEDAGDPAAAFDALRRTIETQGAQIGAEMTVMRRGLEAAFDQLEKIEPAQDYKPQLAQLVQQLAVVAEHLQGVEQSPILRNGPEHYAARLERSGEGLVRTAVQQLERQASDLERAGRNLSAHVASARERKRQNWWLVVAFAIGLIVGALVMLFLPRVLPGSVNMAVAATVMNADRWKAGGVLMQSGSPEGWRSIVEASDLVRANREALSACAEAAAKMKKDQRCTITVSAPEQ